MSPGEEDQSLVTIYESFEADRATKAREVGFDTENGRHLAPLQTRLPELHALAPHNLMSGTTQTAQLPSTSPSTQLSTSHLILSEHSPSGSLGTRQH